jgi:tetratricopeptide (TPR) repeat protein
MTRPPLRARLLAGAFSVSLSSTAIHAAAEDPMNAVREAGTHFERGVTLYGEADYPGALVEFKRAYTLSPNSAVLYNIGEAQYQLQDYASALVTFTRYLAEAPASNGHRSEVESDVEVLRTRVGHLSIVTVPPGADVAVDDQPAGKTPLGDRVLVGVGHRKVTAALPGRPPATRFVDVAADDNVSVTLDLLATASDAKPGWLSLDLAERGEARGPSRTAVALRTLGWVATGVLAVGAGGAGVLALKESAELKSERNVFPASPETLQEESARTRTYSVLADSLTTAAVVLGGITLLSTVTSPAAARRTEGEAQLRVSPMHVDFDTTF